MEYDIVFIVLQRICAHKAGWSFAAQDRIKRLKIIQQEYIHLYIYVTIRKIGPAVRNEDMHDFRTLYGRLS